MDGRRSGAGVGAARSRASRARLVAVSIGMLWGIAGCGASTTVDNAALRSAAAAGTPAEVTVSGRVTAVLPDGPARADGPHQRFDLAVAGLRVEVDHNLDLAPRVPVTIGSMVVVHGQFEPDPGRPVIHDTHHATGRHEGGWIEFNGHRYE